MDTRDIRPDYISAVIVKKSGEVDVDLDVKVLGMNRTNLDFRILRFVIRLTGGGHHYCIATLQARAPGETATVDFHNLNSVWTYDTVPGTNRHAMPEVAKVLQEILLDRCATQITTAYEWAASAEAPASRAEISIEDAGVELALALGFS